MNEGQAVVLIGVAIIVSLFAASCGGGSHLSPLSILTTTLPAGQVNNSYNVNLSATGGTPPYTWTLASGSLPAGLSLGTIGSLTGTPTTSVQSTFTVQVTDSNSHTATQQLMLTINPAPQPLAFATLTVPEGAVNVAYSFALQAMGGVSPYTYSISQGTLPSGLTLSSAGVISGTPTQTSVSVFTVQVADSEMPAQTASAQFTLTVAATPLSITTKTLPDAVVNVPYGQQLQVTGGVPPYTWQEQNLGQGFFLTGGEVTTSEGFITEAPKIAGVVGFTAQVSDSANGIATQPLTVTIDLGGNILLNGPYAFIASGFAPGGMGQWAMAGSFVADGNGNITSGEFDSNSTATGPENSTLTGTYSIAPNGLGTMTLNTGSSSMTFAFALSSRGGPTKPRITVTAGQIIEFDDASGQGSRATGVITEKPGSNINVAGNLAFGYSGLDVSSSGRVVEVGEFTVDANGGISNGVGDSNTAGTLNSLTISGNVAPADSAGRSVAQLTVISGGKQHMEQYAFYWNPLYNGFTESPEVYALRIDPIDGSGQLLSGALRTQSLPNQGYNNSSISGILAMRASGTISPGSFPGVAAAGLATCDGAGNVIAVDIEQNVGGTVTSYNGSGTYNVASNGRVTISAQGLASIGYLIDTSQGLGPQMFAIAGDATATLASMQTQQGGAPFSNASLSGYYSAGTLPQLEYGATNSVFQLTADGNGNLTGIVDSSGPNGLQSDVNTAITYSLNPLGKSQLSGSVTGYMYVGSYNEFALPEFVVVTDETNPRLLTILGYGSF